MAEITITFEDLEDTDGLSIEIDDSSEKPGDDSTAGPVGRSVMFLLDKTDDPIALVKRYEEILKEMGTNDD